MARKVFFSFHYERDAWRAGQVRNCNVIASEDQVGFIDSVDWESIKKQGEDAIKRWIATQLKGTSVTVVLIGAETADREWVQHEIIESWNRGNGVVGVWIHNVKDADRKTDVKGPNPLDRFTLSDGKLLSSVCKTYDWVQDSGRDNLGGWADEATEIRSQSSAGDKITAVAPAKKGGDVFGSVGKEAGAAALGALVAAAFSTKSQASSPSPLQSRSFTPRAPWCSEK